ncbi:MAG: hypothetical protein MJA29_06865 [Candidatus Omnitrophica bacterium]|nr:hypothetical protein [Candidatus Omnitrophota bacterium]
MYRDKAQGVLEYVIILTAIVAVIIVASQTLIRPAVDEALIEAGDQVEEKTGEFLSGPLGWEE